MNDQTPIESSELAFLKKRVAELETRETQLQAGYEHLKLLYEQAPLSYQSLDENGCFIDVNQAWLDTLGYAREEVMGRNFGEFLHPDWTDHFKENFPKFKAIGEILGIEFEMVKKDGQSILVSFTGKIGKDTHSRFQQTHCIFQDISERKRAEEELRTSESKFRSIIDIAPVAMALNDEQQSITFLNPAFVQTFGYTLEDIPTLSHWWPLAYPDPAYRKQVAEAWQAELEVVKRTGAAFSPQEVIVRCKDLTSKTVLINAASISNAFADNHVVIYYDITERKQSVEALLESEQNFRTLSNSGQALIWTSGTDKLCNYFNTVWLEFTGRTLEQEMGIGWAEGVHPDDMQRCLDIYTGAFDRREKFSMEYRLRRHDGEYRWILDDGCPRYNSKGEFLGYIGHCLDITRRRRADEETKRNESRLRKLVDILQYHTDNINDLLDYALEQALQLTESKIAYIYNYHEERKELVLNSWSKDVLPACVVANPQTCYALENTGIWGEAVRQRRPLIVNDFQAANPLEKGGPEGHVNLLKFVAIPIFKGERIVSVVGLANKKTDYDETDILQISLLMDAVWKVTDSIQADKALRVSEVRYAETLSVVETGLWDWHIPSGQAIFSKVYYQILGYEDGEFPPTYDAWRVLVHPDDIERVEKELSLCVESGEGFNIDLRMKMKSGRWCWVSTRGKALEKDNENKAVRMLGTLSEINERKQAERDILNSEARFRTLVQTIPDLIWLKDQDGVYLSCNKVFERLFGSREEDIVGKTDYDFVDRELADLFRAHDKKAIAAGIPSSNEEWVTFLDDGHRALLETIKTPMYDGKGTLIGVLSIGRDITKRKRNEEALQHYSFLMKEMGKAAKIGGWEFDTATGKGTWTEEVALIHEVDPNDPTNVETGTSFYTDESKEKIEKAIHDAIEFERPYILELELITGKGNHKWVKTIGHPFIENNKVTKVRGSFQDITERKQTDKERENLQEQLTQAQKMESVGRLAGGVAHDFNNMLSVIIGYAELARGQVDPSSSLYHELQAIYDAGKRSADITRQLLAFARKQTIAPRILDLNDTVEDMLKMLRRLMGEDINLAWLPGPGLAKVKMDPSQLDQLLANLCVNSRDAIAGVGKVTVETSMVTFDEAYCADHTGFTLGDFLLLAVSDDGCGMDKELLEKVFEPFFTTKEAGKGTGLGLATVYGIAKQNNGFVDVYSEPGHGTTFKIYLPVYHSGAEEIQTKNITEIPIGGKETILIVEDEAAVLGLSKAMLEKFGYNVLTANTPSDAMVLVKTYTQNIDLLVTDVIMPGMNGRDLSRQLLTLYPDIKTLFMSGYTADVIAHQGILNEGVHFIHKPFSSNDLAEKVREALGNEN